MDRALAPAAADLGSTWALVPLRGLADAKTRLSATLDPEERLALVTTMAIRTLAATRDAASLRGTVLVTADPAAAALAREFGARTIVQRLPGLNAALREARAEAIAAGATAVLVVPIDLPAISPSMIEALIADAHLRIADRPLVVAVPDRHGRGTNALLISPADAIDPAFGEDSFEAHAAAAHAAGAEFLRHEGPLTLDLDTGDDLLAAAARADGAGDGSRDAA
ncbi:MAG: 2-phospho-L-lactate guanylyltransferase CofC [Chloroflexi bacterium]|nr:2-phospho-L-lactate guanylyltransferase CofC [Chloroflexota bacterium]